jgi:putative transposase
MDWYCPPLADHSSTVRTCRKPAILLFSKRPLFTAQMNILVTGGIGHYRQPRVQGATSKRLLPITYDNLSCGNCWALLEIETLLLDAVMGSLASSYNAAFITAHGGTVTQAAMDLINGILPMNKSKFTEQQIAFALQQAESGTQVAEVCRKMGIAEATSYRWKQLYGGLMPSEVKKLRQLEENTRLRRVASSRWASQLYDDTSVEEAHIWSLAVDAKVAYAV